MSGTHGDLFQEIGALVVAAHRGAPIDLSARAGDLAERYVDLGVPADTIERAIARSIGAVCVQSAMMSKPLPRVAAAGPALPHAAHRTAPPVEDGSGPLPASPFPSGLRLAVLS